jgi:molybdenum cofactor biosynthesis enzyme MoaA
MVECRKAQDRSEVDDRIIKFRDIVDDMVNNRFYLSLPPSFTMINNEEEKEGGQNLRAPIDKRKGAELERGSDDKRRWIDNPDQIAEFKMKDGEDWKSTFCGKCAEARPTWKGKVKMCPRWNTKGGCFKDCKHGESHVSASQIPENKRAEYRVYLNKVRGE